MASTRYVDSKPTPVRGLNSHAQSIPSEGDEWTDPMANERGKKSKTH